MVKEHIKVNLSGRSRAYDVNIERYDSADAVVNDCRTREQRIKIYDMSDRRYTKDWQGVSSYDEALDLLKNGYQPTVDELKNAIKTKVMGEGKRIKFENNVHGFAPIVPLAMKGVPNSMVNMTMKPIKAKVVDIYYDAGASANVDPEDMIKAGQKLLGTIVQLEKQGYKFNLYTMQAYSGDNDADILCVKVKSSDKPLDLKRISFPLAHPAFFRVIGFDWEGKSPIARDRGSGRGCPLIRSITEENARELAKQVFGKNAIYFSCVSIMDRNEEHIKEVLTNADSKH